MYVPRHWHFAISAGLSLIGFFIMQSIRKAYGMVTDEVWVVFFVFQYFAVVHVTWIYKAGLKYQSYITHEEPKAEPLTNWHTGQVVDEMPKVNVMDQQVVYTQAVTLPRFDMERQFAKDLLVMRDYKPNDEAVDLTEKKWVRPNKFETRKAYVDNVLKIWKYHNVIAREN